MNMTPREVQKVNDVVKNYKLNALLSILTEEQKERYKSYLNKELPNLRKELGFLANHDADFVIKELTKVFQNLV